MGDLLATQLQPAASRSTEISSLEPLAPRRVIVELDQVDTTSKGKSDAPHPHHGITKVTKLYISWAATKFVDLITIKTPQRLPDGTEIAMPAVTSDGFDLAVNFSY